MICNLESWLGAFLEWRRIAHIFCIFVTASSTQDFITHCAWNKVRPAAVVVAF